LAKEIESRASNFVKMRITGTAGDVGGIPVHIQEHTHHHLDYIYQRMSLLQQ
jgi:hypothetical protein